MIGKRGGIISFCIDRIKEEEQEPLAGFEPRVQPTGWASNSGVEKDSLDHSAIGQLYINKGPTEYCIYKQISSPMKTFCRDLIMQPQDLQSTVLTTQLLRQVLGDGKISLKIKVEANQKLYE